jgi:hypothetical protein
VQISERQLLLFVPVTFVSDVQMASEVINVAL